MEWRPTRPGFSSDATVTPPVASKPLLEDAQARMVPERAPLVVLRFV